MKPLLQRITEFIVHRPVSSLVMALSFGALCVYVALGLRFDTSFAALLPRNDPTVAEVERLKQRAGATVDMIIGITNVGPSDVKARRAFARRLVARLEAQPWVRAADTEYPVEFFKDRRLLFLSGKTLARLDRALGEDIEKAKARANPLFVDLEDKRKPWAEVKAVLEHATNGYDKKVLRRYLVSKDNRYQFVRVKPGGTGANMEEDARVLAKVKRVVRSLEPARHGFRIRYSGPVPINLEQHRYMSRDLRRASFVALCVVLLLLTVATKQPAAPVILAIPLLLALSLTLAITRLLIGQLNIVSGFLLSALIGIGIDYGIYLYLRYLEYQREDTPKTTAMRRAIARTFPGCLTAGLTTIAAFLAMLSSEFRGFREYGVIASIGVTVSLAITFASLPPLALLLSRQRTVVQKRSRLIPQFRLPFAATIVFIGIGLTAYAVPAGSAVRFENDFKHKLRFFSPADKFAEYVERSLGGSLTPAAVAVHTLKEARAVERLARQRIDDPTGEFARVLSLSTMVPDFSDGRVEQLARIRKRLQEVPRDRLNKQDRKKLDEYKRLASARPWKVSDIPHVFTRLFRSTDAELQFVLIWPRREMSKDDEIIGWAHELDRLQARLAKQGISVSILDENRVAARALSMMREDGPRVLRYAAIAIVLILLLDFRSVRSVVLVGGTLALGFVWTLGAVHLLGMEINVFNMAVLPTLVGVGVDNAVHLMHRYNDEGRGSVAKVVSTTGLAAVLASATTGIGFGATIIAHHNGIKSMGQLALVGFGAMLVASTAFFPALLRVLELFGTRNPRPAE